MGLDMYAYALTGNETETAPWFHYWRKHHALCHWLAALCVEKGGETWDEPARSIELDNGDLDRLERAVFNGEIPDTYGNDAFRRDDDLEFVRKARAALSGGKRVEVVASW